MTCELLSAAYMRKLNYFQKKKKKYPYLQYNVLRKMLSSFQINIYETTLLLELEKDKFLKQFNSKKDRNLSITGKLFRKENLLLILNSRKYKLHISRGFPSHSNLRYGTYLHVAVHTYATMKFTQILLDPLSGASRPSTLISPPFFVA